MAAEGLKKKDIQRRVQKVHTGATVSSIALDASTTTDTIELGFPVEKMTIVCSGTLAASVQPKVGAANAHTAISATTTASTTTLTNMAASVTITRSSGAGKVIILAK